MRYAVLVESTGLLHYMDSVRLLKAVDFRNALQYALEAGLKDEKTYANGDGKQVRWRLASIISLDWIGDQLADGQEVYSEPVDVSEDQVVAFEHEFHPETSQPTQTF
jgi:hypothetical protein